MKAHEPIDFAATIQADAKSWTDIYTRRLAQHADSKKYEAMLRRLSIFYAMSVDFEYNGIVIRLHVKSIKDVEPALKVIEMDTNLSFGKSHDDAEWRMRSFSTEKQEITVVASLVEDTENCRRVQVGEKTVPVYELRCDDEETSL